MKWISIVFQFFIVILLTTLTQIGGLVYLLTILLKKRYRLTRTKSLCSFFLLYFTSTLLIIPLLAPLFGRVALPYSGNLRPLNVVTCLLNRHYVKPSLQIVLEEAGKEINERFEGSGINYLDAGFPFFDGFPLIPHLSHNDGRKIDLAFFYQDAKSKMADDSPSWIGYGIYDEPKENESDYPKRCSEMGYWQYGLLTYLVPNGQQHRLETDEKRTRYLIRLLLKKDKVKRIFIEPHLKERWKLTRYSNIRFHGCHAVRHDDHIHLEVK